MRNPNRQRGFGLLEVMMAAGLGALVIFAITTGITNLFRSNRSLTLSGEAISVRQGLQLVLSNQTLCSQAFNGITIPATWGSSSAITLNSLSYGNSTLVKVGVPANGIQANSITLAYNAGPFATSVQNPDGSVSQLKQWFATINLGLSKTGGDQGPNVGGDLMKAQPFYVTLLTSANGSVYSCNGGTDTAFLIDECVSGLGGTWDQSQVPHCVMNSVGIGTRMPPPSTSNPWGQVGVGWIDNPLSQGALLVEGASDNNATYAAVYLGKHINNPPDLKQSLQDGWVMAAIDNQSGVAADSLLFGKYTKGGQSSQAMVLTSGYPAKVGIANANPSATLDVGGTGSFSGPVNAPQFITPSDARLKQEVQPLGPESDGISSLKTYRYSLKSDPERKLQLGFIAQEVARLFPEAVSTTANGYLAVNYSMLLAPLVKFTQSLREYSDRANEKQARLEARVQELEKENSSLGKRLGLLEQKLR